MTVEFVDKQKPVGPKFRYKVDNDWSAKFVMGRRVNGAFEVLHSFYTDQGPTRYSVVPEGHNGPPILFTTLEVIENADLLVQRGVPLDLIKYIGGMILWRD